MFIISNEYKPSSMEADLFLSEISDSLIKEGIKEQFNNPIENTNNYVDIFLDKYNYGMDLSADLDDSDDFDSKLSQVRDMFMGYILDKLKDTIGIGIPNFEDVGVDKQNEMVQNIYTYFILNIKNNFCNLVINYTSRYKKSILESFKKKKDVTTLSFKKEINNPDDLIILGNLRDIISMALTSEFDVNEFIDLTSYEECYETEWLVEAYDNVDVTGNFVDSYMKFINDDLVVDIESKIRNKILSKYRNKEEK